MTLHKKFIPYSTQWIDKVDINAVSGTLLSDWITQGPKIREFEKKLSSYCKAKYVVVLSNGTAALHIACLAAKIKSGDEVITSPITFVASANCILYCGGAPIFVDIQKDTANIDPNKIEEKITQRTKAIIPVHFAGHPCDLEQIYHIAKKHNLFVIEDAAHALGAEYQGAKIGSCKYSDMTIFSFHPVKSITTGEGGAVLTNRKDLYEKLILFRNHGITRNKIKRSYGLWYYEMLELGFNYRITDFQCALGINQLKRLNKFIKRRRDIAGIYNREFSRSNKVELLSENKNVKSAHHLYVIKIKDKKSKFKKSDLILRRKNIFDALIKKGIGVNVHYIPVYLQPYYQQLGYKRGICPIAEDYYNRAITLPLYPKMRDKDVKYVLRILFNIL